MTGGFLSVSIMRPNHRWTVLQVSILAALVLTLNADGKDSDCSLEFKVRRNTVYEASVGQDLTVDCTVNFCNSSPSEISWYKLENTDVPVNVSSIHIKTEWTQINDSEGTSKLIFQKILSSDSGLYLCQSGHSRSHKINVSVHGEVDGEFTTVAWENDTTTTTSAPEPQENLWMYMYTAAGIIAFVIIVTVISVISMQGCKRKSKKKTQMDNEYVPIPMVEQPRQPLPRGSPSGPPSRRSTQRKTLPSQPNESPLPENKEHVYDSVSEDRQRQRTVVVEEEVSSVVYAALNHQLPPGAAARPWRPQEEFSEYAAIRVS